MKLSGATGSIAWSAITAVMESSQAMEPWVSLAFLAHTGTPTSTHHVSHVLAATNADSPFPSPFGLRGSCLISIASPITRSTNHCCGALAFRGRSQLSLNMPPT